MTATAAKVPAARLVAWMIKFQFDEDCDFFALDPGGIRVGAGADTLVGDIATYARDGSVAAWALETVEAFLEIADVERAIDWARRGP